MSTGPLDGLRIVECASFVAGPSGCLALGQLGADIIKIVPLNGPVDQHRWPLADTGASLYWAALNKGKRSVAIDLRSPQGRELATELITAEGPGGGVLVDNMAGMAGMAGQDWLSHETLSARRADLIHCHVQGRPDGTPAVDYTVNAEVGIPTITGGRDTAGPVNHVLPAWDLLTGMTAATALLAALHERDTTGQGSYFELALSDVATAGVANLGWLQEAVQRGGPRPRHGNHLYGSFGVDFATSDEVHVMVVALTRGHWRALCEATGTGEVFTALESSLKADLTRESDRYRLRETIAAILRPWFAEHDFAHVAERLDSCGALWSRYREMDEVVAEHRNRQAPSVLTTVDQPGIGSSVAARSPLRRGGSYGQASPAPGLGEHTDQVLGEVLGLSQVEIGRLHGDGLIAGASQ